VLVVGILVVLGILVVVGILARGGNSRPRLVLIVVRIGGRLDHLQEVRLPPPSDPGPS
jgi:hypothetical protein